MRGKIDRAELAEESQAVRASATSPGVIARLLHHATREYAVVVEVSQHDAVLTGWSDRTAFILGGRRIRPRSGRVRRDCCGSVMDKIVNIGSGL
jgi:hypothetical protein